MPPLCGAPVGRRAPDCCTTRCSSSQAPPTQVMMPQVSSLAQTASSPQLTQCGRCGAVLRQPPGATAASCSGCSAVVHFQPQVTQQARLTGALSEIVLDSLHPRFVAPTAAPCWPCRRAEHGRLCALFAALWSASDSQRHKRRQPTLAFLLSYGLTQLRVIQSRLPVSSLACRFHLFEVAPPATHRGGTDRRRSDA